MPSNRTSNPFVIFQGRGKPVLPSVQGLRINISNLSHFQFKNKQINKNEILATPKLPHSVFCTLNLRQDPKLHRNDPPPPPKKKKKKKKNESNFVFPSPQNIDKIFIPRHIIFLIPPPHHKKYI